MVTTTRATPMRQKYLWLPCCKSILFSHQGFFDWSIQALYTFIRKEPLSQIQWLILSKWIEITAFHHIFHQPVFFPDISRDNSWYNHDIYTYILRIIHLDSPPSPALDFKRWFLQVAGFALRDASVSFSIQVEAGGNTHKHTVELVSHRIHAYVWYVYLHIWIICMVNLAKYTKSSWILWETRCFFTSNSWKNIHTGFLRQR